MHPDQPKPKSKECSFVMFRGAMTGRVVTCGVCEWCREHDWLADVDAQSS